MPKDFSLLKIWKLACSSTQKNPHCKLADNEVSEAEHGFVENFVQLFTLRDRFRKMLDDISAKDTRVATLLLWVIQFSTTRFTLKVHSSRN